MVIARIGERGGNPRCRDGHGVALCHVPLAVVDAEGETVKPIKAACLGEVLGLLPLVPFADCQSFVWCNTAVDTAVAAVASLEVIGDRRFIQRKARGGERVKDTGHAHARRLATREEGGTRGRADGVRTVPAREPLAEGGEAVEVGSPRRRVAREAEVAVPQVVLRARESWRGNSERMQGARNGVGVMIRYLLLMATTQVPVCTTMYLSKER